MDLATISELLTSMFNKTYLKLAGLYLAVFMMISLFFSISLYQISIQQVNVELRWNGDRISRMMREQRLPQAIREKYSFEITDHYQDAKAEIISRLFLINIFVLIGGGILSYLLAKWTLRPIEEVHKSLEQFTADASHELRTPLAAMQTETEVALMNPKLTIKEAKKQLNSNLEEVHKMSELTGTMLSLARFNEDGNFELTTVKAEYIISEAINRVKPEADSKKISIKTNFIAQPSVNIAKESVQQALIILIENAIKYSPKSSEITILLEQSKNMAKVSITDHGIGISENDTKYIFNRFYRADSARDKNKVAGNGLGLSIAKNIIEKNKGSIKVVSKLGEGSTFIVFLPVTSG